MASADDPKANDMMGMLATILAEQKAAQAMQQAALAEQKAAQAAQQAAIAELATEVRELKVELVATKGELVATKGELVATKVELVATNKRLAELQAEEVASAATPAEYEDLGRAFITGELERRFGLRAIADASPNREIDGSQWDYRLPVVVSAPPTHPGKQSEEFIIYPAMERYTCPKCPTLGRQLTPTKTPGAAAPPACDYIIIFEIATSRSWTAGSRPMLPRLENRLFITLDRARSTTEGIPDDILSVCALVGVVAPASCQDSVRARMASAKADGSLPLLSKMMDEGRFVFLLKSFP
jgi:hypothetical protein